MGSVASKHARCVDVFHGDTSNGTQVAAAAGDLCPFPYLPEAGDTGGCGATFAECLGTAQLVRSVVVAVLAAIIFARACVRVWVDIYAVVDALSASARSRMTDAQQMPRRLSSRPSVGRGSRAGFFRSTVRTLREVFPEVYAFALGGGRGRSQNIILVCPVMPYGLSPAEIRRGRRSPGLDEMTRSIIDLEEIERLSRPFDEAPLLTDDHSPVETLVAE